MTSPDQQSGEPEGPSDRAPFLVRFPPPFLFILFYVAGLAINYEITLGIVSGSVRSAASVIGGFLVIVGVLIALASLAMFFHRRTTLKPHGHPMHLVDYGPFLISRNPMYLSLVLVYAGAAIWTVCLWALVLLVIPFAIMNAIVIPYEERRLKAIFGSSYDEYAGRVRRWI